MPYLINRHFSTYILLSLSLNKSILRAILSRIILSLIEFIQKSVKVHDTNHAHGLQRYRSTVTFGSGNGFGPSLIMVSLVVRRLQSKVFSTGILKISVATDKREYRIYRKFIGDRNKISEEI
jgi:hypothetical protein